ncbi:MAG TPA: fluoride efflux transporter CrcB [Polyangiaceae bacterium]|nr:fluoride efflux transporter CrcB [Polyangiaceae bacterium]
MTFLYVALAGALGSCLRYALGLLARELGQLPSVGTWTANLLGCLVMGFVSQWALERPGFSPELRITLTVGLLGGFTTYSAFNQEVLGWLREGRTAWALGYLSLTVVGALGAASLGMWLARANA